jgi:VWFA-related protein
VSKYARHVLIGCLAAAGLMQSPAATEQPSAQQQQQPPPPPPQQPRFRTETNLVRVDVYATKDGAPVPDLKAEDFELFEDSAPQKIDSFEHIVVTPAGPADTLVEPNSVAAANQLVADPRRRVFVIYLDNQQVTVTGSHNIKEPLIELMTRMMGPDDLVGVMTPEMSPTQITFGRRTQVIEDGLRSNWHWGRRDSMLLDEHEKLYSSCFPPTKDTEPSPSYLARKMIARYRERLVLDSLQDLIRYMGMAREGRTAVITVSEGWALFKPDPSMMELRTDSAGRTADPIPGAPPPVGVGPGGTLTKRLPAADGYGTSDRTECEKERADLALVDNELTFRNLFGEANRSNVSFYTIDPRGLAAVDPGVSNPTVPQDTTWEQLRNRIETLHTLALNTDGIALVNNNDLSKQIRRMADDLTSYYLIGYYSTNGKLDGKFRNIRVRSKRSGIEVRARKGYTAATAAEVERARRSARAPVPDTKAALASALGSIESDVRAMSRKAARGPGEPAFFHRGPATGNQVQPAASRVFPRSERIRMELEADAGSPVWTGVLLDRNGAATIVPVTTGERTEAATGQRWLTADITLAPLGPADYVVELTSTTAGQQKKTLIAIRVTQ